MPLSVKLSTADATVAGFDPRLVRCQAATLPFTKEMQMNERDDWSYLENEDCYDEFCHLANPANWKNADGSDYVVPEFNTEDADE